MVHLCLKVFFDYSHLERTYLIEVDWPQAPRVGDHVLLEHETDTGARGTIAEVDMVLWLPDGAADVYLDVPNKRDICFGLQKAGWVEQEPDPAIAT